MATSPAAEGETGRPIGVIGIRYDASSWFMRGAAEGPPLIRAAFASDSSNAWTETGFDLQKEGVVFDAGDVAVGPGVDMLEIVESSVASLLGRGLYPICLGGDHSITYPIVRAFSKRYEHLSILHFDAHPDLYDELHGDRYSHACPFARIMEEKLVKRLVQVGVRTINGHQRDQAARFGVEIIEMRHWREGLEVDFDSPLYISFDIDALDPGCAPGVSHREPGGLSTRQAIDVIHRLKAPVVGGDIVEFNPKMDPLNMTAAVCAKLLKEIAGMMLLSPQPAVT